MSLAAAPAIQPVPSLAEAGSQPALAAASTPSSQEPRTSPASPASSAEAPAGADKKQHKKRSLFGFVKKRSDDLVKKGPSVTATSVPSSPQPAEPARPINVPGARLQPQHHSSSHSHTARSAPTSHPATMMGSPTMSPPMPAPATPSSPRLSSPAGSQIFERDVQESAVTLSPSSPAIPAHIQTENHIPPVLDASSEAITDDHLSPDSVEIVTASVHQPAVLAVVAAAAGGASPPVESPGPSWTEELAAFAAAKEKAASRDLQSEASGHYSTAASGVCGPPNNFGSLDGTDVRRLSFISFADVVQTEQQHHQVAGAAPAGSTMALPGSRESMASTSQQTHTIIPQSLTGRASPQPAQHLAGHLASLAAARNRSPSPMRSPPMAASGAGVPGSPPTSKSGSVRGLDMSPGRRVMGSPTLTAAGLSVGGASVSSGSGAELTIETMSQALRKTGSGDLGSMTLKSHPTSPI